jgi:hypothetical protein
MPSPIARAPGRWTPAARKSVQLAGSNDFVNSHLLADKQARHASEAAPEVIVSVEVDEPRPGWAVTLRCGAHLRRYAYLALLSDAKREADDLAAQRGWRRAF